MKTRIRIASVLPFLAVCVGLTITSAAASTAPRSAAPPADSSGTVWLCRPGRANDPCAIGLSATAVAANGNRGAVHAPAGSNSSAFDCFYVYPTVSTQLSSNANLKVGAAEIGAAEAQAAPFSQVCHVFAPIYRQRTLVSLASGLGNDQQANVIAYDSILSGWKDYIAHYNDGRPFVLIGHSQGAAMLILLLQKQIDNDASLRSRLVSAIVLGGNVQVPNNKLVGGSFAHVPGCSSDTETECVIAYSTFPGTPPGDSEFGRAGQGVSLQSNQKTSKGEHVLCTNPAALSGGSGALLPEFLTATQQLSGASVSTPWVEYPKLYDARCESSGGATWLDVTSADAGSKDARPLVTESEGPAWGYHADDVSLALGNLVTDVASEEAAYTSAHN